VTKGPSGTRVSCRHFTASLIIFGVLGVNESESAA
jgi:hypothetical protein